MQCRVGGSVIEDMYAAERTANGKLLHMGIGKVSLSVMEKVDYRQTPGYISKDATLITEKLILGDIQILTIAQYPLNGYVFIFKSC